MTYNLNPGVTAPSERKNSERLAWGNWFWAVTTVVSFGLIAVWFVIPWQWSSVDDPGQALAMRDLLASRDPLLALWDRAIELASGDFAGGVFRPVAWIYPPLLYWMPVVPAHVVRLVMILLIIIGPLVYFRRSGASPARLTMTLLLLLIAAGSLYQGLILLSIQEVGGVTLISLGLLLRGRALRLVAWTLAALFKGPFSWILLGYAVALWREGRKQLAIASGGLGMLILAVNAWWSLGGTYSSRYQLNPLNPELWNNASKILEPVNGAILLAVIWWLVATGTSLKIRGDFSIFAFAAFGYYFQMIPWGFTAYYMGPISFLFGLLLVSMLTDLRPDSSLWRGLIGLLIPFIITVWVIKGSFTWVFETNEIIRQASECLIGTQESSTEIVGHWLYLTTSEEGPFRLGQNIELSNSTWRGQIRNSTSSLGPNPSADTTHVLFVANPPIGDDISGRTVCSQSLVKLIALD